MGIVTVSRLYKTEKQSWVTLPVFLFVGALCLINVHADFVLDIRRGLAGVRLEVFEDNAGPIRIILQKLQGFGHQMAFTGGCLKLVQV